MARRPHELFPTLRLSPTEALAFDHGALTAAELERKREVEQAVSEATVGGEGSIERLMVSLLALIYVKGR